MCGVCCVLCVCVHTCREGTYRVNMCDYITVHYVLHTYVCIFDEVCYVCMYCMCVHATRINAYSCKGECIFTCRDIPCMQVLCDCVHMQ